MALIQFRALTKILSFCLLPSVILYFLCHNDDSDLSQKSSSAHPMKRLPPQLFEQTGMKRAEMREHQAQQMKRETRKLPDHCNKENDAVKEVVIKGERHTGTNWMESILRENIVRPHVTRRKPGETARKKVPKVDGVEAWVHGS